PGGNHGDRLIYKGMEKKLKQHQIKYLVLKYQECFRLPLLSTLFFGFCHRILNVARSINKLGENWNPAILKLDKWIYEKILRPYKIQATPNDVILIHGGGNMNDIWHGIWLLKSVLQHTNNVLIVGPQTYWFNEISFPDLFTKTKQDIYLFCREKFSYQLLNSLRLPRNVQVLLSNDTSFYLSKEDFNVCEGYHDLICLRTDKESALFQKKEEIARFFESLTLATMPEKKIFVKDLSLVKDFRDFIHLIETSKKVYTDRLHVAIVAAILGKETVLYTNSYYKNRGVYDYSLSNYPNVKFALFPPSFKESKNFLKPINKCRRTECLKILN
ncbi:MAG: polysaccharide pyruvyl transferase family protein, partial [Promethearchaeota archaeon]